MAELTLSLFAHNRQAPAFGQICSTPLPFASTTSPVYGYTPDLWSLMYTYVSLRCFEHALSHYVRRSCFFSERRRRRSRFFTDNDFSHYETSWASPAYTSPFCFCAKSANSIALWVLALIPRRNLGGVMALASTHSINLASVLTGHSSRRHLL